MQQSRSRPEDISHPLDRQVYRYLSIDPNNRAVNTELNDVRIKFYVEREWLRAMDAVPEDIVLMKEFREGWRELPTSVLSSDSRQALFEALSPGLSYFAISLHRAAEENVLGEVTVLQAPVKSYSVAGVIYGRDRKPVIRGTKFSIENINTTEVIAGKTGVANESGRFSAYIPAEEGDEIVLRAESTEYMRFMLFSDTEDIRVYTNITRPFVLPLGFVISPEDIRNVVHKESKPIIAGIALVVLGSLLAVFVLNHTRTDRRFSQTVREVKRFRKWKGKGNP